MKYLVFFVLFIIGCKPNIETETQKSEKLKPQASAPVKMAPIKNKNENLEAQEPKISKMEQRIRTQILEERRHMYDTDFPKTNWIPNRGLRLLSSEETEDVWLEFAENRCSLPSISIERNNPKLASFFAFETEYNYIFAYRLDSQFSSADLIWSVCEKETSKHASYISKYQGEFDEYNPLWTSLDHSCGGWVATVQFRELTRTGQLFLEVLTHRCQDDYNYQEYLFHLDELVLREVKGSRMHMDYRTHPYQSWRWWYAGEKYEPRNYEWSGNEAVWKRQLKKVIEGQFNRDSYPQVLVKRKCRYKSAERKVTCEDKITRSKKFKENAYLLFLNREESCKDSDRKFAGCEKTMDEDMKELIKEGFYIEEKYTYHYMNDGRKYRDW